MRIITVILLVSCFCFLSTRSALVFSYFKWNQNYIIANFCENKEVKKYTCHGNCRLSKMMQTMEQKERPASAPIIPNLQLEEFFPSVEKNDFTILSEILAFISPNFNYTNLRDQILVTNIFHPPKESPFIV